MPIRPIVLSVGPPSLVFLLVAFLLPHLPVSIPPELLGSLPLVATLLLIMTLPFLILGIPRLDAILGLHSHPTGFFGFHDIWGNYFYNVHHE